MTKISQLADIGAGLAAGDEFIIRDVSDVSTPNKKVTASGFLALGSALGIFGSNFINAGATGESRVETVASGISGYVVTTISGIPSARTTISGYYENASGVVSGVFYPVVTQVDIGTAPNQVPVNGFLGTMAFQDAAAVNVDLATITTATISSAAVTAFSNVPLLTGGGLKFPATQVASADPNTLDDYEEGTWTPALILSTTNFDSINFTNQAGVYTKVGNIVYAYAFLQVGNFTRGSGSGNLQMTGLPFTVARTVDVFEYPGSVRTNYTGGAAMFTNNHPVLAMPVTLGTGIQFFKLNTTSSYTSPITQADMNATGVTYAANFYVSVTYRV